MALTFPMTGPLALLAVLAVGVGGHAPTHAAGPPPASPAPPAQPTPASVGTVQPPVPRTPLRVVYPATAPPIIEPITVVAKLVIDATGAVAKVEIVSPANPIADDAVSHAASAFTFEPATLDGQPIAVQITFTHTFVPVVTPPPNTGPLLGAVLSGRLRERGTGMAVAGAAIAATIDGVSYTAESDASGRFRIAAPAGAARVVVHASGYRDFVQREVLVVEQALAVGYYLDAEHYDPYEIVIHGGARREEVSRVKLEGHEAKQVAGTLGDPFRVVQALPGVGSVVSLAPLPVVRGASPGSTGLLLDGLRVPLLFHLLAGPSVIHPDFIDDVAFYPGGFPVSYGGYTAGIVDGHTVSARPGERRIDIDLNLTQVGAFVQQPLGQTTLSVAARYGYPGLILGLVTDGVSLSYWDYQVRFDAPRLGLTIFAYGAGDRLEQLQTATDEFGDDLLDDNGEPVKRMAATADLMFHRLDVRYALRTGPVDHSYRLVLGYDESVGAEDAAFRSMRVGTYERWQLQASGCLTLAAGLDFELRDVRALDRPVTPDPLFAIGLDTLVPKPRQLWGGAFIEGIYRPIPELVIRPGLRIDGRWDGETEAWTLDPRLNLRLRLARPSTAEGAGDDGIWLKASIGLYHQPPRLPAPVPGLDELPLRFAELQAIRTSFGAEIPVARDWRIETEAYFDVLDPVVFELSLDQNKFDYVDEKGWFDAYAPRKFGRAYGLELMLRKRDTGRGLHGWLAYTLSRSERKDVRQWEDHTWYPFEFDRTHLVSLVLGWTLPRNWELGARLQYQSGHMDTGGRSFEPKRGSGYVRLDLRIDKHAVWNHWLLDFYVDLANVTLSPEDSGSGKTFRYILPTLGVRARL